MNIEEVNNIIKNTSDGLLIEVYPFITKITNIFGSLQSNTSNIKTNSSYTKFIYRDTIMVVDSNGNYEVFGKTQLNAHIGTNLLIVSKYIKLDQENIPKINKYHDEYLEKIYTVDDVKIHVQPNNLQPNNSIIYISFINTANKTELLKNLVKVNKILSNNQIPDKNK